MSRTTWIIIFSFIVVVVILLVVKAFSKTKGCQKGETPFQCVQRRAKENGLGKGQFIKANPGFPDMFDYPYFNEGTYRFYSDGKVIVLSQPQFGKGIYDKESINWENGTTKTLDSIFAKEQF